MLKLIFYEELLKELEKRSTAGRIMNEKSKRGNLAYLCERYEQDKSGIQNGSTYMKN